MEQAEKTTADVPKKEETLDIVTSRPYYASCQHLVSQLHVLETEVMIQSEFRKIEQVVEAHRGLVKAREIAPLIKTATGIRSLRLYRCWDAALAQQEHLLAQMRHLIKVLELRLMQ